MTFNSVFKEYNKGLDELTCKLESDLNDTLKEVVTKSLEEQHNNLDFTDRVHESLSVTIDKYLNTLVKTDLFNKHINNLKNELQLQVQESECAIEAEYVESIGTQIKLYEISNQKSTTSDDRVADIFAKKLKDVLG
jgi:hypothetical protein